MIVMYVELIDWGYICLFNYNKMKRVRLQRKEEDICAWGVEQQLERDIHFVPKSKKKVQLLPQIGLSNKCVSSQLSPTHLKRRKQRINPQQVHARRLKSQSNQQDFGLRRGSKGQASPSLPALPSLTKKISKSEAATLKPKQDCPSHPNHNKSFVKYDQITDNFDFKLLQKKLSSIQSSSKQLHQAQYLRRRGSEATLKVKTIQMLTKQDQQQDKKQKNIKPKKTIVHSDKLGMIDQAKQSGEYEFNDGSIFSKHPILYTSIHSPLQFKGQSKTDRYRIIIK